MKEFLQPIGRLRYFLYDVVFLIIFLILIFIAILSSNVSLASFSEEAGLSVIKQNFWLILSVVVVRVFLGFRRLRDIVGNRNHEISPYYFLLLLPIFYAIQPNVVVGFLDIVLFLFLLFKKGRTA